MAITAAKKVRGGNDSWGTPDSFLLVFFPQDHDHDHPTSISPTPPKQPPDAAASTADSPLPLPSPSRRTRSRRLLLSRALSTLSICALLLSLSLLLFSLSSLDHSPRPHHQSPYASLRSSSFPILWRRGSTQLKAPDPAKVSPPFALQGMGFLHRRGSHAMPDLVVGHVPEDTTEDGLRLFLRALHRSSLTAWSDVVFVFPDRTLSSSFVKVIEDEDNAFLRLLDRHLQGNRTIFQGKTSNGVNALRFDAAHFVRKTRKDKEAGEPLWGKRTGSNSSKAGAAVTDQKGRPSYGSVVSFVVAELDPEGSLLGFLDHVPMSLRRWSCSSMLLGRLRRNFKHVMLIDVKNWVVLSNPFIGVWDRSPETVVMWGGTNAEEGKRHGRGKKEGTWGAGQSGRPRVNPGAIIGGMRGVRRVAEAMQMEIVRVAMQMQDQQQRKRRRKGGATTEALSESGVMSQLVGKEFLSKNVELVVPAEEDSTLGMSSRRRKGNKNNNYNLMLLWVGNNNSNNNIQGEMRKLICSSEADLSVIYSDCELG
ncbi:hypothetical protein MLD38_004453 [Melastoma candidum]|uniref:Uncharacterized protein n=1 Tax=Melastoma candidum TaxID=119954 RepID=A0ACB9S6J6_9MYRT|nr:hypothetical protein MLD38_004453 [Melastoma candidum]